MTNAAGVDRADSSVYCLARGQEVEDLLVLGTGIVFGGCQKSF